jgi:hypothetical protein
MAEHEEDHEHDKDQEQAKLATPEQRLWSGICFALSVAGLCGAFYLDIVHGSTQWQASCVVAFVCYFFAACAIGAQGDAFVEPDEDEKPTT